MAQQDNDASRWREPRSRISDRSHSRSQSQHACPSAVAVSAERHEAAIPLGRLTGRMHDNGTSQSGATSESPEIGSGATIGRPLSCSRLTSVTVAHRARPASRNLALETGTLGTTFSTGTTRQKPSVMNRAGTLRAKETKAACAVVLMNSLWTDPIGSAYNIQSRCALLLR